MTMKIIVLFVDEDHMKDVEQLFEECDVPGYSEIPHVLGKGASGKKLGNRAFPGSSTLYMLALDETCEEPLRQRLQELARRGGLSEGLKMYSLDATELV